jgi:hypothetical protein
MNNTYGYTVKPCHVGHLSFTTKVCGGNYTEFVESSQDEKNRIISCSKLDTNNVKTV